MASINIQNTTMALILHANIRENHLSETIPNIMPSSDTSQDHFSIQSSTKRHKRFRNIFRLETEPPRPVRTNIAHQPTPHPATPQEG